MIMYVDVSFIEVAMTLVCLGAIERFILPLMPEDVVGPEGWLLKTID